MTTIEIELGELRALAYEQLKDELGDEIDEHLEQVVKSQLIQLWDNRDEIQQAIEQQQ